MDTIQAGGKPGSIYCLKFSNLNPILNNWRYAHGCTVLEVIQLAQQLTGWPQIIVIFGIEPMCLEFGCGFSEPVQQALPKLIQIIMKEFCDS